MDETLVRTINGFDIQEDVENYGQTVVFYIAPEGWYDDIAYVVWSVTYEDGQHVSRDMRKMLDDPYVDPDEKRELLEPLTPKRINIRHFRTAEAAGSEYPQPHGMWGTQMDARAMEDHREALSKIDRYHL